jgi:hypothetical protein
VTKAAEAEAKADQLTTEPEKALIKIAPKLAAISAAVPAKQTEKAVRDKAKKLVAEVEEVLVDIDEVGIKAAPRRLRGYRGAQSQHR